MTHKALKSTFKTVRLLLNDWILIAQNQQIESKAYQIINLEIALNDENLIRKARINSRSFWTSDFSLNVARRDEQIQIAKLAILANNPCSLEEINGLMLEKKHPSKLRKKKILIHIGKKKYPDSTLPHTEIAEALELLLSTHKNIIKDRKSAIIFAPLVEMIINLIHPFEDGNGRTARMFAMQTLLNHSWPIANIIGPDEIATFYGEIWESHQRLAMKTGDQSKIVKYWLENYARIIKNYKSKV